MLARRVDFILAALLLALLLSLQIFFTLLSKSCFYVCSFLARKPIRDASSTNFRLRELHVGDEFSFEHAIEAYEGVIDAAYAQRRA